MDGPMRDLEQSVERLSTKIESAEAAAPKLEASVGRLRRSVARLTVLRTALQDSIDPGNLPTNGVVAIRTLNRGQLADAMYGMLAGPQYEHYLVVLPDTGRDGTWQLEELVTTPGQRTHRTIATGKFVGLLPGSVARFTARRVGLKILPVKVPTVLGSVGAYQLEGLGAQMFERIEGDYFVILGLPLLPVLAQLRKEGLLAS